MAKIYRRNPNIGDVAKKEQAKKEPAKKSSSKSSTPKPPSKMDKIIAANKAAKITENRNALMGTGGGNEVAQPTENEEETGKRNFQERIKNTGEVLGIALNPFSKDKIEANIENQTLKKITEFVANKPYSAAAIATGAVGLAKGAISLIGSVGTQTAVSTAATTGTLGYSTATSTGTAGTFATNAATAGTTTTWLAKLAVKLSSPAFIASGLVATIGSYPFAGFINEEALQTSSFAVKSAIDHQNIEGAKEALALQKEMLDPDLWNKIMSAVPFVNVVANLNDFYEAAAIKVNIDEKIVQDMKIQIETGETDDEKWTRIKQEEIDMFQASKDLSIEKDKQFSIWEREAAVAGRNEDASFWAKERDKQRKLEAKDREAIADFWTAYRKRLQEISNDNRPSALNFGLI